MLNICCYITVGNYFQGHEYMNLQYPRHEWAVCIMWTLNVKAVVCIGNAATTIVVALELMVKKFFLYCLSIIVTPLRALGTGALCKRLYWSVFESTIVVVSVSSEGAFVKVFHRFYKMHEKGLWFVFSENFR